MSRADSSIARAWRAGGRALVGAAASATGGRTDLILPRGWPESADPIRWRLSRRGGAATQGEARSLGDLPKDGRDLPVYVWTPAAETILTTVTLPTRSRRKIMQALPYALEERLVGDPESLHFAWRLEPDGRISVAVTARARLESWQQQLARGGIRPAALCPTTLLVPWAIDHWSLAFVGDSVTVRTGAVSGFDCPAEVEQPPALLIAAVQEAQRQPHPPEALVVFQPPPGLAAESWSKALGLPVRIEPGTFWDKQPDRQPPLDLLQGQIEEKRTWRESMGPFLPAAVLLVLWAVSSITLDLVEWWRLQREQSALRQEMTSILLASFPDTKTVLDPAAQMKRSVDLLLARGGRGDQDLISLLAKTVGALKADPRMRMRGLRYDDSGLTLEITWPTPSTPEAARTALEAVGLQAEVLSVTPRAGEVDGRVRVRPAAGKGGA